MKGEKGRNGCESGYGWDEVGWDRKSGTGRVMVTMMIMTMGMIEDHDLDYDDG